MNTTQGVPLGTGAPAPVPRTFVLRVNPKVLLVLLCIVISVIARNPGIGIVLFVVVWWYGLPPQENCPVIQVEYN